MRGKPQATHILAVSVLWKLHLLHRLRIVPPSERTSKLLTTDPVLPEDEVALPGGRDQYAEVDADHTDVEFGVDVVFTEGTADQEEADSSSGLLDLCLVQAAPPPIPV